VAGLTLDAGALIAYERGDARAREVLRVAFDRGLVPTVPAVVVAEVWRGGARSARTARLLKACVIEALDERWAREAGELLSAVAGAQTVDACVAAGARRRGDALATSDAGDMRALMGPAHRLLNV
jgi:predicted nucleic acid-binding protein